MSKADEQKYWQAKLALTEKGSEENIAVRKKVATAGQAVLKQEFDATVEALHAQEKEYQHNLDAKMELAKRESDLTKQKYGEQSKEYQAAQAHIVQIKRAAVEEMQRIADIERENNTKMLLAQVSDDEIAANLKLDMRQIDDEQMLKLEASFEERRYEINRKALEDKLKLEEKDPDRNPEAMAQLHAQIEDLERQHALKMKQIQSKQTLDANKNWLSMTQSMQSAFANVIASVVKGQMTMAQGMRSLMQAVAGAVIDMLAQILAKKLVNWAIEKIFGTATAQSQIEANAGVAASAAMGSVAAIPFYGWAMAPMVGAATFAAASAYGLGASAEGGYDIPAGVNPLTQLHQKEMVLPAEHADTIRNMSGNGGGGAPINFNVTALDGHSVKKFFDKHGPALADALRGQGRNFNFQGAR